MTRRVILTPEAVADVEDAWRWYEDHQLGLGDEFLIALDQAYDRIAGNPAHYPIRFDAFRRCLIRRFPYAVYFEAGSESVWVYGVYHCARSPERLVYRLR